ncbi:unnamed protein product [Lampetra planeri]
MSAGRRLLLLLLLLQEEEEVVSSEEEQDLRLCTGERAGRGAIRCVRVSELPREVRVRGGVVAVTAAGGGSASAWASPGSASRDQAAARGGLGRGSANCTRGGVIALHALYAIAPRASARRASALQRDASPRRLSAPPRALVLRAARELIGGERFFESVKTFCADKGEEATVGTQAVPVKRGTARTRKSNGQQTLGTSKHGLRAASVQQLQQQLPVSPGQPPPPRGLHAHRYQHGTRDTTTH